MPAQEPSQKPIAAKLGIKPGHRVLVYNHPADMPARLGPLPEGATIETTASGAPFDAFLGFARNRAEAGDVGTAAVRAVAPDGLVWIAYPKKSGRGTPTDINRDTGWDALTALAWRVVSLVALDDTWSALRFRPAADVKSGR